MSNDTYSTQLESRAQFFKALGHPARLLIINLVKVKPRHTEELAAILNLKSATVSHHLSQLTAVGLLASQKDQYYQMYSLTGDMLGKKIEEVINMSQPGLETAVSQDAYRDKVIKNFFNRGRLTQIPAQQKKRQVIMEKLVEEFEPGQEYTEQEVNRILIEFHDDVATLRREFIAFKLMIRDHGIYQRAVHT
ncbi:MAG: metalloregulator ArsR/SmtB family transcription factor [Anaerolineae bacterium]|nr:metalloregulator ArsR/SmtB family transcription factor [Anaerolineae bacterium]